VTLTPSGDMIGIQLLQRRAAVISTEMLGPCSTWNNCRKAG